MKEVQIRLKSFIEVKINMANLEDAIKLAHSSVFKTTDSSIVIDRTARYASRTRLGDATNASAGPGIAVVSKGGKATKVGNGFFDEEPNSEARFWRAKFEQLQGLQMEAESDLGNQLRIQKEKERGLEQYISLLQQKITQLEGGINGDINVGDGSDEGRITVDHIKRLNFFELMTGMTVEGNGKGGFNCSLRNTLDDEGQTTRFTITTNGVDANELDFAPKENISMLPDFLQSEISFESNQAPAMLAGALMNIYDNETNGDGDADEL